MYRNKKDVSQSESEAISQIVILGLLVFVTILAPALLHTNQLEFLVLRFEVDLLTASYFDTALYTSYLVAGILSAIISNQIGKRKIFILIGSLGSAVFYFLMTSTLNFTLLLVFRFIQGSLTVLSWQTLMTMVLDLSIAQNRGRNLGIFGMFLALAMGGGPVFGGILAGLGVLIPYFAASVLSVFVFIVALVLLNEPPHLIARPSILENVAIGFRKPRLVVPAIFNFVDRFHIGFILFILPLFLPIVLGVEPELRGMVLGLFALPFIILQYPVGKWSDKIGRYKPLIIGSLIVGFMLSVMGYLGSFGLFTVIIGFIILGIGNGFTGPTAMALVGDTVEADDNATAMGFFNLLGNVGIAISPLVGGFLVYSETEAAFITAFVIAGLIEILSLIGVILLILFVFTRED
jgi:MFS family permease